MLKHIVIAALAFCLGSVASLICLIWRDRREREDSRDVRER